MPPGICVHGVQVEDTENMCEMLSSGAHREYVSP